MRKGCLIVVGLLVLLLVSAAVYLFGTIPSSVSPVALESSPQLLAMLRLVPSDASEIFVIPQAGGVYRQLRDHPLASSLVERWATGSGMTRLPLILGSANVVAWRRNGVLSYLVAPDPFRGVLLRLYLAANRNIDATPLAGFMLLGDPTGAGSSGQALQPLPIASGLTGQVFVFETSSSSWKYPPIGRPALSAAVIEGDKVTVTSRAAASGQGAPPAAPFLFYPEEAMLSAANASVGDWLRGLDRLLPVKLSPLLQKGALVSLYKVDKGTLLPRLRGLAIVPEGPDTDALIALLDSVSPRFSLGAVSGQRRTYRGVEIVRREGLGFVIEYARTAGRVLVAFDKSSIEDFVNDKLTPVVVPPGQTVWFLRIRPAPLVPVLDQLHDRQELTLLAPEIYQTIGDLQGWLEYADQAHSILMIRQIEGPWDKVTATAEAEPK